MEENEPEPFSTEEGFFLKRGVVFKLLNAITLYHDVVAVWVMVVRVLVNITLSRNNQGDL